MAAAKANPALSLDYDKLTSLQGKDLSLYVYRELLSLQQRIPGTSKVFTLI